MRRIYIYQQNNWPNFTWYNEQILPKLMKVRNLQGRLIGKMESLGFHLREEAILDTLTLDILKSNEIEGEILNSDQVRSSIAKHLKMDVPGLIPSDRHIDGIVEMMLDATQKYNQAISKERLCNWHASLFPTGRSGMHKITVANWRKDDAGPMQVVSGAMGKEKIHFQALDAKNVSKEMNAFIKWFNKKDGLDTVIKSAIAHLWFITIHPFDDGNGRIARAIADMQLARADESNQRFYSMSAQIRLQRKKYYDILEKTQKGNLNINEWLYWYLDCLIGALNNTDRTLERVLTKASFWKQHATIAMNKRQHLIINKLFDAFEGKLTTSKWAKINKCSPDTALRDIQDLINKNILMKEDAGGRSTNYLLNV